MQTIAIYDAAEERNPMAIVARGMIARLEHRSGNAAVAKQQAARAVADARTYARGLAASEWLGSALLAEATVQDPIHDLARARRLSAEAVPQLRTSVGPLAPATKEALLLTARLAHVG